MLRSRVKQTKRVFHSGERGQAARFSRIGSLGETGFTSFPCPIRKECGYDTQHSTWCVSNMKAKQAATVLLYARKSRQAIITAEDRRLPVCFAPERARRLVQNNRLSVTGMWAGAKSSAHI